MLVCLRSTGTPFFRESTSGNAVLIASWFDSGYVDVSLRRLLYEFTFSTFGYSDPSIDSCPLRGWKLCFRIQRNAWSSVVHALRPSRSLLTRFTHFLREGGRARAIRAGNVDIISRPLYLAVYCSVSLASEHTYADFWEMIPGIVSTFYAPWFGSGCTYGVSLRGYGQNFTRFLREGGLLEMTSCLSPCSALGSSSDTCTASVHTAVLGFVVVAPVVVHDMCRMVQTMQNCLELPQVQFLRVCGRRCVHAATSSRQSWDGVQFRSSTRSRRTEMCFFASFFRHFSPSVQLDVRARVAWTRES